MTSNDQAGSQGRILVVEDDPEAAKFTVHVLSKWGGFEVIHIEDPAAALIRASSEPWDLVITDVEMPGMTGLQLLEALREVAPAIPVAVVTAHVTVDNAVTALRHRADEFLEKPLQPERLIATAHELISRGRAARLAGREVVLAIGAHPDDIEIGVGGTLLAHHGMGHEISVLTMCRGARGGSERTRVGESQQAAEILGAELYLEDLEDTRISEGDPTISLISRVIESVQPTLVYTHSINDVHQDHRNTHRAAMVAARQVGRVYCYQSPSATVDFAPTRFVTIDEVMRRKLAAIDAFASQVAVREYLEPDLIEATARYWSRFGEGRYAEPFEVIRDRADVTSGSGAQRPTSAGHARTRPAAAAEPAARA
ncbi:MAG: response regulator [Streptosporangiaceae bacterium]|jgi:LmbE family N-acetylglucosaminyl deacetylase/ActR/RegA family two-component response regulator